MGARVRRIRDRVCETDSYTGIALESDAVVGPPPIVHEHILMIKLSLPEERPVMSVTRRWRIVAPAWEVTGSSLPCRESEFGLPAAVV